MTDTADKLAEALREIEWSNDSAWQSQRAREALATYEREKAGQAPSAGEHQWRLVALGNKCSRCGVWEGQGPDQMHPTECKP